MKYSNIDLLDHRIENIISRTVKFYYCVHRYDNGDFYIFATGGYTPEKGLFTQQYKYK